MFHKRCLQNCLWMLLAVYLIKTGVDLLCVFSKNFYKKYFKLSIIVQNVIKAALMYTNPYIHLVAVCQGILNPTLSNTHTHSFFLYYYKKCIKLAWIKNKNLWGGELLTSSTKSIACKHKIRLIFFQKWFSIAIFLKEVSIATVLWQ